MYAYDKMANPSVLGVADETANLHAVRKHVVREGEEEGDAATTTMQKELASHGHLQAKINYLKVAKPHTYGTVEFKSPRF